jgi:bifunctional non-homologous end joining protein LigD
MATRGRRPAERQSTDALSTYREKRDFGATPEPAGTSVEAAAPQRRFVVQRHRARRLHYDLRFEVDGVLASWAVPKGPTLDPAARRLAVHVEDHPIEYLDFEGVIPSGQYGGGDVIVWDRGTWEPHATDDPAAAIAAGELHADVYGDKLRGRLVLIRRDGGASGGGEEWLLLHKRDDHAVAGWNPEDHPRSVKSGRTNEEVAARPTSAWRSDLPADRAEVRLDPDGASEDRWEHPTSDELDALDQLGQRGTWEFQGVSIRLTNLDKVLFPGTAGRAPVTKRDLIRYHACIAPTMLPFLVDRPLNTKRFPDGVDRTGFWQKAVPSHAPEWVTRWHYESARPGKTECYVVADRPATLVWLANNASLELHPWTSTVHDVDLPTYALIDIDPGTATTFDDALVLARLYRAALDHLDVEGRPKVTGQRGIQIWVPISPGPSFDDTREWVEQVSRAVGATVPELVSWEWRVSDRGGLARLDYTQNAINKTLVAPYSVRPAPGAPVSVPVEWHELDDPDLRPDAWDINSVIERVTELGDPFRHLLGLQQTLPVL